MNEADKEEEEEEEMLSFLPVKSQTQTARQKYKELHNQSFCLPWMMETITIMCIIAVVVLWKVFHLRESRIIDTQVSYDESSVQEWNHLKLSNVKQWCLHSVHNKSLTKCQCANPLQPQSRHGYLTWTDAFEQNVFDATNIQPYDKTKFDVVFLGDSITEGWKGTSKGQKIPQKQDNVKIFHKFFYKKINDKEESSARTYDALVLGISGDKSPHLLWRIQNGEIPDTLQTKVWWILIGTNDFLRDYTITGQGNCSAQVVFMGIQRVVEELRLIRPNDTIVVNSILPRATGTTDGHLYNNKEDKEKKSINLMDAVNEVNRMIKAYCNRYENVKYFDATNIFVRHDETLGDYIPKELMADYLHPTAVGYNKWGLEIVEILDVLIP